MNRILRFTNLQQEFLQPLMDLQEHLGFTLAKDETEGMEVVVNLTERGLTVDLQEGKAEISYHNKVEFFRGLGLLIEAMEAGNSTFISETPAFTHLTYMQDNSRNAVCNIDTVKKTIRQMALMGYNSFMLYTEDTYEIEEYPYFGYMRGRFSKEELCSFNIYAESFGIELVPCIQTLAHLNAIFHWAVFDDIRDIGDILLCGNDKTYELIEAMVRTCSEVFSSKRINIGMDEAEMFGLGKYLKQNGYILRSSIMMEHLKRVVEICEKYNFHVMMWSDMFINMLPNNSDYRNVKEDINTIIKGMIPENVQLIYWDYYTRDKSKYDKKIDHHKQLSNQIVFAGGAWKWQGFAPLLHHSMIASKLALQSCLDNGISDVIVTGWGDNGAESSNFVVGPVLQLYAEVCYNGNDSDGNISRRLKTCTHMDFYDFMELDSLNLTPDNPSPGRISVGPAKYIFYQDVLQGLYDKHIDERTYAQHFKKCYQSLSEIAKKENEFSYIFDTLAKLGHVLELKCDLGIRLKDAYDHKNLVLLEKIEKEECPELLCRIEAFHVAFRNQWYQENKAFGFDSQDLRIGGLKERIHAAIWRIDSFVNGNISNIEELEQERLLLDNRENPGYRTLPLYHNDWRYMVTASIL